MIWNNCYRELTELNRLILRCGIPSVVSVFKPILVMVVMVLIVDPGTALEWRCCGIVKFVIEIQISQVV